MLYGQVVIVSAVTFEKSGASESQGSQFDGCWLTKEIQGPAPEFVHQICGTGMSKKSWRAPAEIFSLNKETTMSSP